MFVSCEDSDDPFVGEARSIPDVLVMDTLQGLKSLHGSFSMASLSTLIDRMHSLSAPTRRSHVQSDSSDNPSLAPSYISTRSSLSSYTRSSVWSSHSSVFTSTSRASSGLSNPMTGRLSEGERLSGFASELPDRDSLTSNSGENVPHETLRIGPLLERADEVRLRQTRQPEGRAISEEFARPRSQQDDPTVSQVSQDRWSVFDTWIAEHSDQCSDGADQQLVGELCDVIFNRLSIHDETAAPPVEQEVSVCLQKILNHLASDAGEDRGNSGYISHQYSSSSSSDGTLRRGNGGYPYGGPRRGNGSFDDTPTSSRTPTTDPGSTVPRRSVFACPFRKRNPKRFNIRSHTTCATLPFQTFWLLK